MKLLVLKRVKREGYRGEFEYIFFKGEDGKSYRTCISEEFRNSKWWRDIRAGMWIEVSDSMVYRGLVDADAVPKILEG